MRIEQNFDYAKESILVVDDDENLRKFLAEMLKKLGFAVYSVATARKAFTALEETAYSFVITDISMPGMDGLELIVQLTETYPDLCTIAMTGYLNRYKYTDVVTAGATDFINKPFSMEELEAKLRKCILERNIKQDLNRLSITDSLTGLYNQRHFYTRLKDEIIRGSRQHNHRIALLFLDLDGFKQYNDDYGHLAGDKLLKKVGSIIDTKIRQGVDSGYRYGGDEFAIILIDAGRKTIQRIINRISKSLKKEFNITASFGYSSFSGGMSYEDFVAMADKELYREKEKKKRAKQNAGRKVR